MLYDKIKKNIFKYVCRVRKSIWAIRKNDNVAGYAWNEHKTGKKWVAMNDMPSSNECFIGSLTDN